MLDFRSVVKDVYKRQVLAVLGWIVYRQLETVDMLEALKSVE